MATPGFAQLANTPWPKWQRDLRNSGYTPAVGPDEPHLKWKLECFYASQQGVVIGPEGELYTGLGFRGFPPGMVSGDYLGFYLTRINAAGQVEWTRALHDFYSSIPTLAWPDRVYAVDGDSRAHFSQTNLYAFTRGGGFVWQSRDDPPFSDDYNWCYMTIGNDGTIYYLDGPYVLALNASDASIKWMRSAGGQFNFSAQCPSIGVDGTVYVAHGSGNTRSVELWALDPQDGTIRWSVTGPRDGAATGTSLAADGTIYTTFFTASESVLIAVSPEGDVRWQRTLAGQPAFTPSIDARGRLYLKTSLTGGGGKFLECYDRDGTLCLQINAPGWAVPIVIDGRSQLYFVVHENWPEPKRLVSYTDAGEQRWSLNLGEPPPFWQAPVIGADGTIYVAADQTGSSDAIMHLYAFGPGEAPDPAFVGRAAP